MLQNSSEMYQLLLLLLVAALGFSGEEGLRR